MRLFGLLALFVGLAVKVFGQNLVEVETYTAAPSQSSSSSPNASRVQANDPRFQMDTDYDFRTSQFGDTRAEVQRGETRARFIQNVEGQLLYQTELLGLPVYLVYYFYRDTMFMAIYHFDYSKEMTEGFLGNYTRMKIALNKKYGSPYVDRNIWNATDTPQPERATDADVLAGNVSLVSRWRKNNRIDIMMIMKQKNGRVYHAIFYVDVGLLKKVKTSRQSDELQDL